MSSEGKPVSYLGSTFVPGEEACFCRFAAGNVETVKQVNELAGFPFWRIVGAQFVEVHHPNEEEQA